MPKVSRHRRDWHFTSCLHKWSLARYGKHYLLATTSAAPTTPLTVLGVREPTKIYGTEAHDTIRDILGQHVVGSTDASE